MNNIIGAVTIRCSSDFFCIQLQIDIVFAQKTCCFKK